jgi:hypothetical protein
MRSIKLVLAFATTTTLLALTAVGAAARPASSKHAHATGACHLRMEVPRGPIAAEEPATIFGQLKCSDPNAAMGKQVDLYEHAANRAGYALVATASAEKEGFYQFPPLPLTVNSVFYVLAEGARSAHRTIRVSPIVTLVSPTEATPLFTATGRQRKAKVIFMGSVSPNLAGSLVALQREDSPLNEEWHRVGDLGRVKPNGEYEIARSFAQPDVVSIRVVVHPPRGLGAAGASTPVSYVISQPQNPLLTIQSSVDPLSYGQGTTISGVVSGAADKTPVTLLARTRGGAFAPAATGVTSGNAYSFTQTPLQTTHYRVASGPQKSSTLVEGVKFAITAPAPPSTVAAGQPLTFSGAVKGAQPGHVVYLERKSPSAVNYHVSDIGTLVGNGTETTYSIVHAFYGPGETDVRVKVPGDGNHQAKATEPTKITVTPSPASALRPEAPGNSKQPSGGQF